MSDSGQKFIKRNRPPRVQISYEDPYDAEKQVELPFVMGIHGRSFGQRVEVAKPPMADRKFANVDMDNFDDYMASVEPAVDFPRRPTSSAAKAASRLGVKPHLQQDGGFRRPARSPARCRRCARCWRRASSSPICSATWTARSPPRTKLQEAACRSATDEGAEGTARCSHRRRSRTDESAEERQRIAATQRQLNKS